MENDVVKSVAANVFAANSIPTVFYSDTQLTKQHEVEFSNTLLDKQQQQQHRLFNDSTNTDLKKISSLEKTGNSLPVATIISKKRNDNNEHMVSSSSSNSSFIKNNDTPITLFTINRKVSSVITLHHNIFYPLHHKILLMFCLFFYLCIVMQRRNIDIGCKRFQEV